MPSAPVRLHDDPVAPRQEASVAASVPWTRDLLAGVRRLILSGAVVPGSPIRQMQLATDVGVSRVPLREFLSTLIAERLLQHTPPAGSTVNRLSSHELGQVCTRRRLLSDFYRSLHLHGADRVRRTTVHNREVVAAARAGDVHAIARLLERKWDRVFNGTSSTSWRATPV